MNMKRLYQIGYALLLICWAAVVFAQQRTLSGRVTSAEDGQPMPGVNVTIKGQNRGAVTDVDGRFVLSVDANAKVLVFSFIGMKTREVDIGAQSVFDIVMQPDTRELREVVVTAFGIERSKQEVSYAVQEVKGEELAETLRPNVLNSLQGRVAGMNVGLTVGTPGASSQIVLRGATSMDGNNQPLFVVDGVPVDNSTMREGFIVGDAPNRNSDYTNRIADLNPNDIESVTVLKGPAAAALYGVDAAGGAIIITTKKGKKGTMKIEYSANSQWERITRFPKTQDVYGFNPFASGTLTATTSTATAPNVIMGFWGAEIPPGTPRYNNLRSVFQWGFNQIHNINISGGSDLFTYNASGSVFRQNGSIPNTKFDRNTFRLSTGAKLSEKIRLTTSVQYTSSFAKRPPVTKGAGSAYNIALTWPNTRDIRNTRGEDGALTGIADINNDGQPDDVFDNPFFNLERNITQDKTNRVLLNGSLSYDVLDWLNLTGRLGYDNYYTYGMTFYDPQSWARYPNRNIARLVGGVFAEYENKSSLLNSFLLINAKKKLGDFNTALTLGNYTEDKLYRVDSRYGENLADPNLLSISSTALATREVITRGTQRRLVSVFGELKADYKNMVYLSITGRNDWSSTMPRANRSFFYPSISGNAVISEILGLESTGKVSFAKARISYAEVGKDAPPHQVLPALQEFTRTGGGYNVGFFGPNPNLVPERTTSFEAGFDVKFFGNRLGVDFTYYRMTSRNQIVQPRLSYASGYILQIVNSGEVENRGVEIVLNANPIRTNDFDWSLIGNFALNRNKVLSLPNGYSEFYLSDTWLAGGARAGYVPGESILTITGNTMRRDANGNIVIANTGALAGYPIRENTYTKIGNRQPLFNFGLTNNLKYKNFTLSFLFDLRWGGDVFNATDWALTNLGLSMRTLQRGQRVVFEGVLPDGTPNTREVELNRAYFSSLGTGSTAPGLIEELFIEKNIKALRLRDVTFTYTMPKNIFTDSKFVKSLQLTATGTNLWLLTNYTGADPDVNGLNASARGSGAMGFDYYSVPAPIAFALGLRASF
jgi:TonB-linked SusC/RagA family outer membrane protein